MAPREEWPASDSPCIAVLAVPLAVDRRARRASRRASPCSPCPSPWIAVLAVLAVPLQQRPHKAYGHKAYRPMCNAGTPEPKKPACRRSRRAGVTATFPACRHHVTWLTWRRHASLLFAYGIDGNRCGGGET